MHSLILPLILCLSVHLVPEDVTAFTIQAGEAEPIRCARQPDNGWKCTGEKAIIYIDGTTFTAKSDGTQPQSVDLASEYGEELTKWIKAEGENKPPEIALKQTVVRITKTDMGIDAVLTKANAGRAAKVVKVRWDVLKKQ